MFGFLFAGVCLAGLFFLHRGGHRRYHPLYRAFSGLDATPGQEQVIRTAISSVREAGKQWADDSRQARPELGNLLAQEEFDEERVKEWVNTRRQALDEVTPAFIRALKEVHGVLDPRQRKLLQSWASSGPWPACRRRHHFRRHYC